MILTGDPQKDAKMIKFVQTLKNAYGANFLGIVKVFDSLSFLHLPIFNFLIFNLIHLDFIYFKASQA